MRYPRVLPALVVLFVLFTSQAGYAIQAELRSNGHCAGRADSAPPAEGCPLPLWLPCCDDQAAVGTALNGQAPGSLLALPLDTQLALVLPALRSPLARPAQNPPDTPLSRSVVLLI